MLTTYLAPPCSVLRGADVDLGLNLLEIVKELRDLDDDELTIQCDVFCDEKHADEDAMAAEENLTGVDLTSHQDVFSAIYEQVPVDIPMLLEEEGSVE